MIKTFSRQQDVRERNLRESFSGKSPEQKKEIFDEEKENLTTNLFLTVIEPFWDTYD